MFDFLKKNEDGIPPDVGKEDEYDALNQEAQNTETDLDKQEEILPEIKPKKSLTNYQNLSLNNPADEWIKLEIEKINARLEAVNQWMAGYSERFSTLSERIGEIRTMAMSNEKLISKCNLDSSRAMDLVNSVKPERLRLEYQRLDLKVSSFLEKLEAKKQYEQAIMNELKDLRQKAGIFIGTDGLLKLNEEVKKDLIEIQKVGARVRMDADKAEQIFIELKSGFAEIEKAEELTLNLHQNYSGMQKEVQKLKLDFSSIIKDEEFEGFKKSIQSRLTEVEKSSLEIEKVREENSRLGRIIETTLGISKKNKEEISDIATTIGDNKIKSLSDYEAQIDSLLTIIDTLAQQIAMLRKKLGMAPEKVNVLKESKKIIKRNSAEKIKQKKLSKKILQNTLSKKIQKFKNVKHRKEKKEVKKNIKLSKKKENKKIKKIIKKKIKKNVKNKVIKKRIVSQNNSLQIKKPLEKKILKIKGKLSHKKNIYGITKKSVKPEFIEDSDETPEIKAEAIKEEKEEKVQEAINVNPADEPEKKGFFGNLFGKFKSDSEPVKY